MNERLRAALIGCGSVSQRGVLPHLDQEDAREVIELVAVCDVVEERARETAGRFQVPEWYTRLEDLAPADGRAVEQNAVRQRASGLDRG